MAIFGIGLKEMEVANKKEALIYRKYCKRALDVALTVLLAIPSMIIVLVCVIGIKIETKGSAFFKQERPGRDNKIFYLLKLRTMIVETERNGVILHDMQRLTKIGKVIRALSFDELPQLWNILKGDMSFIGPRPLLVSYLPLYNEQQRRRHEVLPGITGLAQVNGRNELTWEEKFEYDVWYVDHLSVALDMKIFWKTIVNILSRKGINAGGAETMESFKGTKQSKSETIKRSVIDEPSSL